MRRRIFFSVLTAVILVAFATASPAQAQWHGHSGVRTRVFVGGFWGYPWAWGYPYWGFGPYWGWGPWWGPGYGYGYPWMAYGPGYSDNSGKLKLEVKPKDAQVYVDGYYRGIVDDFDGVFSRLHVEPGEHQLVIYKSGLRTIKQDIRVRPRQDSKIKYVMQQLPPGQASEAPPQPPPQSQQAPQRQRLPSPRYGRPYPPPARTPPDETPAPPPSAGSEARGFGTLVFRVQPADAQILIDGERWQGPQGEDRLVVQVAEGSHRVEIRKEGFETFTTEVTVHGGETTPLNVSLPPSR